MNTSVVESSVNVGILSESTQAGCNAQKVNVKEKKLDGGEVLVRRVGLVQPCRMRFSAFARTFSKRLNVK